MSAARPEYPESPAERDAWILARRGPREAVDPLRAVAALSESEPDEHGRLQAISTIFLSNRECPWRCLMCDLWRHTLEEPVERGAIETQIRGALAGLPPAPWIKLYNSGSFFDAGAIPRGDYGGIAREVGGFERVIVESHPALVGDACLAFRDLLAGGLEVAIGLETIHPDVLPRLNKRMSLEQFECAAAFLEREGIGLRVFVLLGLPFLSEGESLDWAVRSVNHALARGASAVSIVPTRRGNGALDDLARRGAFARPSIGSLETALEASLARARGRVFADLWNLEAFRGCGRCFEARRARLEAMNRTQRPAPPVACAACGGRG